MPKFWLWAICLFVSYGCSVEHDSQQQANPFGTPFLLAGEPTAQTVTLQARLNAPDLATTFTPDRAIPGMQGYGRFLCATDSNFTTPIQTKWQEATAGQDYLMKAEIAALTPDTRYFYRLQFGEDTTAYWEGRIQTFRTLPSPQQVSEVSFVMVTGSHYERFYLGGDFGKKGGDTSQGKAAYSGEDAPLGFPALATIAQMQPDFYIGNGDNVYYDHPPFNKATALPQMRERWHHLMAMPRMQDMLAGSATYWLKDDHDHRFDDSDTLPENPRHGSDPSHALGVATFLEQVPLASPNESQPKTYRTHRVGRLLQIWMLEGRDYRTPNAEPDGPQKTIWGEEQKNWLKQTLLESDATFKLLISPTPMVGPDDQRKSDNHTNPNGFRTEGDAFYQWLAENQFLEKNFFILCGDRHWQYHSIHPTGFEEFSSGALVDQNSRLGRNPGDPGSTDPEGEIKQPYTSREPSGGFLKVVAEVQNSDALLHFVFYDEYGEELYRETKKSPIL